MDSENVRCKTKTQVITRSHKACLMSQLRIQFPSSNGGVCTGRVGTAYDRSSVLGFAPFCTACVPHCSLAATTTSNDGSGKLQTTETSKQCPLLAGRGHQHFESGEGRLWYSTSPGSIWLRQYPSNDDQGAFSTLLGYFIRVHV